MDLRSPRCNRWNSWFRWFSALHEQHRGTNIQRKIAKIRISRWSMSSSKVFIIPLPVSLLFPPPRGLCQSNNHPQGHFTGRTTELSNSNSVTKKTHEASVFSFSASNLLLIWVLPVEVEVQFSLSAEVSEVNSKIFHYTWPSSPVPRVNFPVVIRRSKRDRRATREHSLIYSKRRERVRLQGDAVQSAVLKYS